MWKGTIRKILLSLSFLITVTTTTIQGQTAEKPIVLWHGMGDSCCNPESMGRLEDLIQQLLPGTFVHSVQIGKTVKEDHEAGFFGIVNNQIDFVCEQLSNIPELKDGFNAIGFSQGGLFLRGYVERCNQPSVHKLITFGSPHGGVTDIPNCMNPGDLTCRLMRSMVRYGAYSSYVQHRVIQAQYFKDPKNLQGYLDHNIFLPDLNNEFEGIKNKTYSDNLSSLDTFVMIRFADDSMVKPGETAWFWTYNDEHELVPLEHQSLYKEDWLGLRKLGGRLKFLVSPGQHMQITDDFFETQIVWPYLAAKDDKDSHHLNHNSGSSSISSSNGCSGGRNNNSDIISSNGNSISISGSDTGVATPRLVHQQP